MTFFLENRTQILLSILLFLVVFIIIGIPWTNWWFSGEDDFCGLFLGYKTKSLKDLFYFFYEGNVSSINMVAGASNYSHHYIRASFLEAYYRPLHCIGVALQFWLFGTNGYGYLLTNVFFHAVNTVILFNIFYSIINYYPAALAALTFAFHPQIAYRFGTIANFQYYINVTFFLLVLVFFKKYLDTKKIYLYLLSVLFFILSLFTRETTIVFPAILFLGSCIYPTPIALNLKNFIPLIIQKLKITSGFLIAALAFLMLRLYLYPLQFVLGGKINFLISIQQIILTRFPEIQVFIYDILGLSWLPYGHPVIRGVIVLSLISFLTYLFIKNTKKIYILFFLICTALMVWPGYASNYTPRYFYEVHPFTLLATVFLFAYYPNKSLLFKKIGYILLTLLTSFYVVFNYHNFELRNNKYKIISDAIIDLTKKIEVHQNAVCLLSYPYDFFGGSPAAIFWILLNNPNKQIYCEASACLMQTDSFIVRTTKWMNIISKFYDENYLNIVPVSGGFRYRSLNPIKISFPVNINQASLSLGNKIISKKETVNNQEVVTDFTLLIDEKYLNQDPIFIRWDYKTKKFEIVQPPNSLQKSQVFCAIASCV